MTRRTALSLATLIAFATALRSAPPQVTRVTSPLLRVGASTTITIDGSDLLPDPRVLLSVPVAAQEVKEKPTDKRVQIEVKLADGVSPGVYLMRVATDNGVSAPIAVEIDEQVPEAFGPEIAKLPAYLQGTLAGSATLTTRFAGKKGQRVVVEVEARRIGSAVDPVVKLLDPRNVQLTGAAPGNVPGGDARLVTVLPEDGTYTVELHDLQYRAGNPNRFRLKVGDFPFADLAFPLAGRRDTKAAFELIGAGIERPRVEVDLNGLPGGTYAHLPRVPGLSSLLPRVLVSDVPEVIEGERPMGKPQAVAVPAGINGRIVHAGEEDGYRLAVQPGMKLKFDVLAERAGSPLDGVLILRDDAGKQLARGDDQAGTLDPGAEYTVPAGVTSLVAAVSDLHGRGGPEYVYRLAVTLAALPDFTLELSEDRLNVPRSGAAILRVRATRAGYDGPIKLTLAGLPAGVAVTGDEIPAGATDTLVSLTVPEGAKLTQAVLPAVTGEGAGLKRVALAPETPLTKSMPWLRSELAVAVTEPDLIAVAWESLDARLAIGTPAAARVKVTRSAEAKGNVRLSLLTSQDVPKRGNRPDETKAIRIEGMPTAAATQTTTDLKLLVPADLPAMAYDLAVRAELLGPDNRTVIATAVTPARRIPASK